MGTYTDIYPYKRDFTDDIIRDLIPIFTEAIAFLQLYFAKYHLDVINPEWRLRSRRETQFAAENVEAILIRHRAMFLKSRRSFAARMQFLPLAFR